MIINSRNRNGKSNKKSNTWLTKYVNIRYPQNMYGYVTALINNYIAAITWFEKKANKLKNES